MMRGYNLWKPKDDEDEDDDNDAKGMDVDGDDNDEDDGDNLERHIPSYASRLAAAKMFLELGRDESCEIAADILNDLVLENEDDPELYFLLALAGVDRVDNLNLAAAKLLKARNEGQTDLEHLQKAIANALKSVNQ